MARSAPMPVAATLVGVAAVVTVVGLGGAGYGGVGLVGSLFVLTWATALGAVVRAGAPTWFAFTVAIAYPATDLMLVVIVVLLLATARVPRAAQHQLALLGGGLFAICFSDSLFAY